MTPPNRVPEPSSETKKPRPLIWLATAVLGVAGILGLMRMQPAPDASPPATPSSVEATPEVKLDRKGGLSTASTNPLSDSFSEPQLILFLPDDNGDLKKRALPPSGDIPRDPRAARENVTAQAVRALLQASPDTFPPGTTLQSVSMAGGAPTVSLSREFGQESFWQGSTRTSAALDALAMTIIATKNQIPVSSESDSVRILVDGKPAPPLGEMDLREPYTPSAKAPPGSEP